ncbi:unnamed protein product [Bursaphelenchus okinawaensis]|uniref:Uncharacterized protein n=1 Tax=Bursaphelenchus okinawaensis TaxID=465554 RepID=A0A811K328_9BILA|nr:unnamed protein product [Bursaphelenchus okinawaensis]CAG9090895.1 unnamed protein product [Bursaphelenchus okinawaensis]
MGKGIHLFGNVLIPEGVALLVRKKREKRKEKRGQAQSHPQPPATHMHSRLQASSRHVAKKTNQKPFPEFIITPLSQKTAVFRISGEKSGVSGMGKVSVA